MCSTNHVGGDNQQLSTISIYGWSIFVEPTLLPCSRRKIISLIEAYVEQRSVLNHLKNALIQSKTMHNTPDFLISGADKLIWGAIRILGSFGDDEVEDYYETQQKWQDWKKYWNLIKDCSVIVECKNEKDIVQVI